LKELFNKDEFLSVEDYLKKELCKWKN
jgi:hypothetical protein